MVQRCQRDVGASQRDKLTMPILWRLEKHWFALRDGIRIGTAARGRSVSRPPVLQAQLKPHHPSDAGTKISAETDRLRRDVEFYSFFAIAELPRFNMNSQENPNQPVYQMGSGVNAKMFANKKKDGSTFDKVQLVRTYKDGQDFKSTPSYSIDELPLVAVYAMKMYEIGISRRIERSKANANLESQTTSPASEQVSNG